MHGTGLSAGTNPATATFRESDAPQSCHRALTDGREHLVPDGDAAPEPCAPTTGARDDHSHAKYGAADRLHRYTMLAEGQRSQSSAIYAILLLFAGSTAPPERLARWCFVPSKSLASR